MRKVHMICSLLLAFSASLFGLGCEGAKAPDSKMTGTPAVTESPKGDAKTDDKSKKATGKKKASGSGSTTGGGVEVPVAPAGGTTEKPEAKTDEKAPETKPEEKTEEKKAE